MMEVTGKKTPKGKRRQSTLTQLQGGVGDPWGGADPEEQRSLEESIAGRRQSRASSSSAAATAGAAAPATPAKKDKSPAAPRKQGLPKPGKR